MNKSQVRRKSVQGAGSKSNLSMSTSRTSMSNRRQSRIDRTGLEKSEKSSATKIQVLGDDGRDVTPKVISFFRMIGRSASKVPESARKRVKAAQGQGYALLGRGLCRGYNWQDPQGFWPKFEGLETIEDCAKECKKDKGCTAFDVSPSDVKSKFRCVLHGHGDIGNY